MRIKLYTWERSNFNEAKVVRSEKMIFFTKIKPLNKKRDNFARNELENYD